MTVFWDGLISECEYLRLNIVSMDHAIAMWGHAEVMPTIRDFIAALAAEERRRLVGINSMIDRYLQDHVPDATVH